MSPSPRSVSRLSTPSTSSRQSHNSRLGLWLPFWIGLGLALFLMRGIVATENRQFNLLPSWAYTPPELVMEGGDPYIRALMRTISASEANYGRPYTVLYGGRRVQDLSTHPDQCIPISVGPNRGKCTTAAGRYQFLTGTWHEKAALYHPQRSLLWLTGDYSFEPQFQDEVVYAWLSDSTAWGVDISELLRQDRLDEVLRRLSGTWTSLGYGLESNSVSPILPRIYQDMLDEELAIANSGE